MMGKLLSSLNLSIKLDKKLTARMAMDFDVIGIAGLILTLIGLFIAEATMSDAQRLRFRSTAGQFCLITFVLTGVGFAVYVIINFWLSQSPPTRAEILMLLIHAFNLITLPKLLVESYFDKRQRARDEAKLALYAEIMDRSKEKDKCNARTTSSL
jgi:DNA-binding transcriptional regulator of glucitol operon